MEPILLYDGHCLLCDKLIRGLMESDEKNQLKAASLRDYYQTEMMKSRPIPKDLDTVVFIDEDGVWDRSTAVLRAKILVASNAWFYRILFIFPRFIRDAVYRVVAKNRYRWFGRSENCLIPDKHIRSRYLMGSDAIDNYLQSNRVSVNDNV